MSYLSKERWALFRKYFMREQKLDMPAQLLQVRYRKFISIIFPIVVVYTAWLSYMLSQNKLHLFNEDISDESHKPRYLMSITSAAASMIAGATCEGGAAVAFPVLTLALNVSPSDAINLAFLMQSIGMSSATFAILYMKIKLEYNSLIYCTIGGVMGVIIGIEFIAPLLTPAYNKMYFASVWFSFAIALYWLNKFTHRKVYDSIITRSNNTIYIISNTLLYPFTYHLTYHSIILTCGGIIGGIFTSMSGSGLDICSFSILTLLYRVSERVATPTSVVLMATNSIIAALWKQFYRNDINENTWNLWLCCVPVVVIGAPLGAIISSHMHRLTLAYLVYILDSAQLISAIAIIKPWSHNHTSTPLELTLSSIILLICCLCLFTLLAKIGEKNVLAAESNLNLINNDSRCNSQEEQIFDQSDFELSGSGKNLLRGIDIWSLSTNTQQTNETF